MNPNFIEFISKFQSTIRYVPSCFLFVFITFAIHVRLLLGRWPIVYKDNPDNIFITLHEWVLVAAFYSTFAAIITWPILSIPLLRIKAHKLFIKSWLIFLSPLLILVLINLYDRSGYIEWFWD